MTVLYKLTDQQGRSYGGTQWGLGTYHLTPDRGSVCEPTLTYWYASPLLAVLLNPIHGDFNPHTMRLWEGKGTIRFSDGLRLACTDGQTIREVPVPTLSLEQRIRFAVLCAKSVASYWPGHEAWENWAALWLNDKDRSLVAARRALLAAYEVARAAMWHGVLDIALAAYAAQDAAHAAILPLEPAIMTIERAVAEAALQTNQAMWRRGSVIDLATLAEEAYRG